MGFDATGSQFLVAFSVTSARGRYELCYFKILCYFNTGTLDLFLEEKRIVSQRGRMQTAPVALWYSVEFSLRDFVVAQIRYSGKSSYRRGTT